MGLGSPAVVAADAHLFVVEVYCEVFSSGQFVDVLCFFEVVHCVGPGTEVDEWATDCEQAEAVVVGECYPADVGAVAVFLGPDVVVNQFFYGAGVKADGGSCFSVPVCFVWASAEPADVVELFWNLHLHSESGQVGQFALRIDGAFDNNVAGAVDGVGCGVCSFFCGQGGIDGDLNDAGAYSFVCYGAYGAFLSCVFPDALSFGHVVEEEEADVVIEGYAPEVGYQG